VEVALLDSEIFPSELVSPASFKNIEPVPACSVPFTQRLDAKVEVALEPVPLTSMKPAKVEVELPVT
jgi:hypothetical protein